MRSGMACIVQCHSFPRFSFLNVTSVVTTQLPSSISGDCSSSMPSSVGCTHPLCCSTGATSLCTFALMGVAGNSGRTIGQDQYSPHSPLSQSKHQRLHTFCLKKCCSLATLNLLVRYQNVSPA